MHCEYSLFAGPKLQPVSSSAHCCCAETLQSAVESLVQAQIQCRQFVCWVTHT